MALNPGANYYKNNKTNVSSFNKKSEKG